MQEPGGRALGNCLRIEFSKEDCGARRFGFYTENCTMGMLKAANYNAIGQVFLFVGEIVDTGPGNSTCAPVTEVCTANVNLGNIIYRCSQSPGWMGIEIVELQRHINNSKQMARVALGPYQASCMATSKLHA